MTDTGISWGLNYIRRKCAQPERPLFNRKQDLAREGGARYYGDGGTIHGNGELDIVLNDSGEVVRVWFRCQQLPFRVSYDPTGVERDDTFGPLPRLTGVEVIDPPPRVGDRL